MPVDQPRPPRPPPGPPRTAPIDRSAPVPPEPAGDAAVAAADRSDLNGLARRMCHAMRHGAST